MKKRVCTVVCLSLLLMTGNSVVSFARDYEDTIQETFQVGKGGTLELETDRGQLNVSSWDRNEVEIVIEREINDNGRYSAEDIADDMDIDMDSHGNDVTVDVDVPNYNSGFWSLFNGGNQIRLTFNIKVPSAYNLDIKTSGGSIEIDELEGDVVCRTSGGSIKMSDIDGPVKANTSGGSITLTSSTGDANLNTSGGSIRIGDVGGKVTANTSGGGITIDKSAGSVYARTSGGGIKVNEVGGAIDASTSGGSVTAYISNQPGDDCRLSTSGGGVTVYVDPSCQLSINAHTSGGGVSAEGITVRLGKKDKNSLVADMNGGGPELRLRSSGGGITIRER